MKQKLIFEGQPKPRARSRHTNMKKKGGGSFIHTYTPKTDWEKSIVKQCKSWNGIIEFDGESQLRVDLYFAIARPESHYRTGKNSHILKDSAPKFPRRNGDTDNLFKAVTDSMVDGGLLADDDCITIGEVAKFYQFNSFSGVVAIIEEIDEVKLPQEVFAMIGVYDSDLF